MIEAVTRGRITQEKALVLLPALSDEARAAIGVPALTVDAATVAKLASMGVVRNA